MRVRAALLSLAWVLASGSFYAALLLLDAYWNLAQWKPRVDWLTALLLGFIVLDIAMFGLLARSRNTHRFPLYLALLLAVALLSLGLYTSWPEPLTEGLFGRESSSPGWYRAGRLALMSLPLLAWCSWQRARAAAHLAPPA